MSSKNIAKVPEGITRDNVEFVERRKTNSKYNVSPAEKIAAVFNLKFSAFAAELETINLYCSITRARAVWAMRSHFINEILPLEEIDDDDILLDEEDIDRMFPADEPELMTAPRRGRHTKVYSVSRRLISKDIDKIRETVNKALDDLTRRLQKVPQ